MANQERVLAAAVTAMLREGRQVPMASIAHDAGVGVGTLYRNYPTREALLKAPPNAPTIAHRDQLVLPLHGGPPDLTERSRSLRGEIHVGIDRILERGRADHTVRADVTAVDVVSFGALHAQPLSSDHDRLRRNLRRQQRIFLAGLAPSPPELENT